MQMPAQVDGCHVEVPCTQKQLERRSQRVCEFHRKVSSFMHRRQRVRFCTNCNKMQPLNDFDGDYRRARLQLRCL